MMDQKHKINWAQLFAVGVPYLWLLAFFLIPFFFVLKISFSEAAIAMPPYVPTWDSLGAVFDHLRHLNFDNYAFIFSDSLYVTAYLNSAKIAALSTLVCLLISYPIAYGIARSTPTWRIILLTLVILPFWTSFLIRVYAWIGILKTEGLLNQLLLWLGVIDAPIIMQYTPFAVVVGIVYSYMPFMILPLYASLEKLDGALIEAASDLGARQITIFMRIVLPMTLPGIAAGCFLVFIPATGEFVIPDLLGSSATPMIGHTLWNEFFQNRDWPIASAVAVLLLLLLVGPILIFQRIAQNKEQG